MTITDSHVAPLRAYLRGDIDGFNAGMEGLQSQDDKVAFNLLLGAAFVHEMDQRFDSSDAASDVIDFVGKVRAGLDDENREQIDPDKAERLIRYSLGPGNIDDLDYETIGGLQIVLVTSSIRDRGLDAEGIDAFLANVRDLAES